VGCGKCGVDTGVCWRWKWSELTCCLSSRHRPSRDMAIQATHPVVAWLREEIASRYGGHRVCSNDGAVE